MILYWDFILAQKNKELIKISLEIGKNKICETILQPGEFKYIIDNVYILPLICINFHEVEIVVDKHDTDRLWGVYCDMNDLEYRGKIATSGHEIPVVSERNILSIIAGFGRFACDRENSHMLFKDGVFPSSYFKANLKVK